MFEASAKSLHIIVLFVWSIKRTLKSTSVSVCFRGISLLSSFCDDSNLHISLFKYVLSTMGVSKESNSKFLIGNPFHVKLRILSPENCKQSLQVKSWKAEVTAEKKANSRLQSKFRNTSINHNILANCLTSRIQVATKKTDSWNRCLLKN